jgi:Ca2+-binding EF-hand superfamily protein
VKTLPCTLLLLLVAMPVCQGGQPPPASAAVDLLLPGKDQRLRLELAVEGQQPETTWEKFLDRWFDYFDRNGDRALSQAEAARIFPLPLSDGKSVVFDFARADTNKDGKISNSELKAFYRDAGFTPVMTVAQPVSLESLRIGEALFRHLGPDAKGLLTAEKLQRATELLRKLDENEDEILTPAEILSLGVDPLLKAPQLSAFTWAHAKPAIFPTLRLVVGKDKPGSLRLVALDNSIQVLPGVQRVRYADIVLAPSRGQEVGQAVALTKQFCIAQFKNAAGNKTWLEQRQVEDDASLQILANLFTLADRDEDGKLTLAELERLLALAEEAMTCSVVLTLTDRCRNLFDHLDTNDDGRLDFKELHNAAHLLKVLDCPKGLLREQVPSFLRLSVQRGIVAKAFGPLPLIAAGKVAPGPSPVAPAPGPAWFQAMDRNGDGFVSPQEFLGSAELFRRLDLNGDGLISAAEAWRAEGRRRGAKFV